MEILLRPDQFYRRLLAEPFVAWGWVFFSGLVQAAAIMVYLSGPLAGNRALLAAGVAQAIVLPFSQLLQLGLAGLILGLFVGLDGRPFIILSHTYRLQALLGLVLLPLLAWLRPGPLDIDLLDPGSITVLQGIIRGPGTLLTQITSTVGSVLQAWLAYRGLLVFGVDPRRAAQGAGVIALLALLLGLWGLRGYVG